MQLKHYIASTRKPTADGFVAEHSQVIAQFFAASNITSPETLYSLWRSRFLHELRKLRPTVSLRPCKICENDWEQVYEEVDAVRTTGQRFRIDALRTLTSSSSSAAATVSTLLRGTERTGSSRSESFFPPASGHSHDLRTLSGVHRHCFKEPLPFSNKAEEPPAAHISDIRIEPDSESDAVIKMYMKYRINGTAPNAEERVVLKGISNKGDTVSHKLLGIAAGNLLNDEGWDNNTTSIQSIVLL
ncbi:hypothetical protein BDB00DRAFT_892021 [Zychaea mexicana]|uniref:uncharacterized protein n=1 Tax=Zychaea mexicana TaxID=64656 RepID=UPI0022FDEA9F|nr:uncharacterized protein BDB00DRAFT_892021 [Zychaea mexicana]KAI9484728.1 hypothetical protein BDB00DRAFT_892021 [Zychaea mexicana]